MSPTLGPIPLVIGVTGHRDLRPQDLPTLQQKVRDIFQELKTKYPCTPLVVLSPLAEGADRLVAQVGLECGASLIVPLPMPLEIYATDFPDTRADFNRLLSQAAHVFELPLLTQIEDVSIHGPGYHQARSLQFALVGAYVARHCQLLIALWDGIDAQKVGGTSEIADFNLRGEFRDELIQEALISAPAPFGLPSNPLDVVETTPVEWIVTPRLRTPEIPNALERRRLLTAADAADTAQIHGHDRDPDRVFSRINSFNAEAIAIHSKWSGEKLKLPISETGGAQPHVLAMARAYEAARNLAAVYQKKTLRTLNGLVALAFFAVICFDIFGHRHEWPLEELFLTLNLAALALAYGWWLHTRRHNFQNKYQDYRALAEGLRVQFFWSAAGVQASAADHYLMRQRGELDWIRHAVRNSTLPAHGLPTPSGQSFWPRLALVQRAWVEDQFQFFSAKAPLNLELTERTERIVFFLLSVSVLMEVITVALLWPIPIIYDSIEHHHEFKFLLTLVIGLTTVGAALWHYRMEKRALPEQAKQYARSRQIFFRAREKLIHLQSAPGQSSHQQRALDLLQALGAEALAESSDWLIMHRQRPVEPPKG